MDRLDKDLLNLLSQDAREPVANLARKLNVTRSTIYERMRRLEDTNVIAGYTIRETDTYARQQITAHVMISVKTKFSRAIEKALRGVSEIKSLYTVSGEYDFTAIVRTETTHDMDIILDTLGEFEGIEKTTSSIVLGIKFER